MWQIFKYSKGSTEILHWYVALPQRKRFPGTGTLQFSAERSILCMNTVDKTARLIIRMIFGFASDGICQTQPKWLQILRRQCCLPDNCPSNGDCSCVKSFLRMTSFSFPHELLLLRIFHSFIIFVVSTWQCRFGIDKSSFSRNRHREKYLHSWYSLAKTNDRETMSELTVFTKCDLTMVLLKEFPVSMYLSSTCELFVIVQKNKYKYNISEWDMSQPFYRLRLRLLQKVLRKKQHVCPNLSTG